MHTGIHSLTADSKIPVQNIVIFAHRKRIRNETFKTHHFNPFLIIFIIRFRFFYHKHFCIRNLPAPCLLRPLLRYRAWYLCRSVSGRRAHSPAPRRHLCTAPVRSGGFPRQNTDMWHRPAMHMIQLPDGQKAPMQAILHGGRPMPTGRISTKTSSRDLALMQRPCFPPMRDIREQPPLPSRKPCRSEPSPCCAVRLLL